jgi:hypothetical protein
MTVASVTLLENIFKIRYSQGFAKYLAAKSDLTGSGGAPTRRTR